MGVSRLAGPGGAGRPGRTRRPLARAALALLLACAVPGLVGQPAAAVEAAPMDGGGPPAVPVAAVPYYVAEAGESRGPLSLDLVIAAIEAGTVRPWTLVWKPGLSGWIRAGVLPELKDALKRAEPLPPPPPPQPPPPPADLPAEDIYFVSTGGAVEGPLSEEEIATAIAGGEIDRTTLVWRKGDAAWAAAWDIPALRDHFPATPPEVPVADLIRDLMLGTWAFTSDDAGGMVATTTVTYRPDMTFTGFVTVTTSGGGATTSPVSGTWSVAGAAADRFVLTLTSAEGQPGTVQLRVVDRDNLVNETDGGSAKRIGK